MYSSTNTSQRMTAHPVVYPLSACGGKLKTDEEIRYSIRSLEKHLKGDYNVFIVGDHLPSWAKGIELIKEGGGSNGGLKEAVRAAADKFPEGFTWIYDDCCLLRDMTIEELKVTPCSKKYGRVHTKWGESLYKVKNLLEADQLTPMDYSRPHGPYWYNKEMIDRSFKELGDLMKGKFPFESWILTVVDHPRRYGAVKQYYGRWKGAPAEEKNWWFLNYSDKGNTPELREYLANTFPYPSRFEKNCYSVMHKSSMPDKERFRPKSFRGECGDWAFACDYRDALEAFLLSNNKYLVFSDDRNLSDADIARLPDGFRGVRITADISEESFLRAEVDKNGVEADFCVFSRTGAARLYDHLLTQSKWKIGVAYEGLRKYDSGGWYKTK